MSRATSFKGLESNDRQLNGGGKRGKRHPRIHEGFSHIMGLTFPYEEHRGDIVVAKLRRRLKPFNHKKTREDSSKNGRGKEKFGSRLDR